MAEVGGGWWRLVEVGGDWWRRPRTRDVHEQSQQPNHAECAQEAQRGTGRLLVKATQRDCEQGVDHSGPRDERIEPVMLVQEVPFAP